MSALAARCFRGTEQAYELAVLYHERGQLDAFVFWFRVYQECKRDAEDTLRSVAGNFRLCGYRAPFPLRANSSQVTPYGPTTD